MIVEKLIKRAGRAPMRVPIIAAVARRFAAIRGHSLVLVYHRIAPLREGMVIPTVPPDTFRLQMATLAKLGRVVPLEELLEVGPRYGRPRFALTFDDDYPSHVDSVLPILNDLGIPATFFLCGRALHGVGPFWFQSLERLIEARGVQRVAALLGVPTASSEALALACEEDPGLQRIVEREVPTETSCLGEDEIATLARAGMTIGFHTLDHPVLTKLSDVEVEDALVRGRHTLEMVVDRALTLFAYPHGRADRRTAAMVGEAGYHAAWTGTPMPGGRGLNPYLLGRWEPGPLMPDEFAVSVSIRLNRKGRAK